MIAAPSGVRTQVSCPLGGRNAAKGLAIAPDGRVAVSAEFGSHPGFTILRLPSPATTPESLPAADLQLLRRLNAGGRIAGGGFVRQTSAEFLAH